MIIALQTLIFFRESLLTVIDRFLRPYYKRLTFKFKDEDISDVDSDDHVYADYDDEKGVVFYPPVYAQRYAAVTDCLMDERWCGEFEKIVDFGYNDMSFIKYLKDIPGVKHILGVDLETIPLRCSSDLLGCDQYVIKRENPLQITLFQGNAADPDYRLIGCDAVVAIEMIEHMLPHDLERIVHTIFGFIKPRIAVITTPNGDFNVLFKSLEKNGLRRLDHFFEWSREQFNDWCSNIVSRYPQYTVTCKGIGPGPAGTVHLGCCSQLALFVAKEYQKQPDLNLNSLALVAKQPSGADLMNFEGWESPHTIGDNNMLCIENSVESYTQFILKQQQSYMTVILTSPTFSLETMEYKDKMSQCNMDFEFGKNFLMFDEETLHSVLIPRRKRTNRVYMIEDVASRLNCTTLQVKKFSKATQNLLANNKTDAFAHTREVVDEIRHLTKMLNFNRDNRNKEIQNEHIWHNINWGENAPYWNQYYKIIREYNYPFEVKSEECRILDTISEEISRLVDSGLNKFYIDTHKLEIPVDHLMDVVKHITTDTDKVKDILEWNGYEIVDDVLIYSRLAIDNVSEVQEEWQDIENLSDWDSTEVRSSVSNSSTVELDSYGRCLHRVLDQKIHRLRSITDDSITTELDRIVCRLMKLALYATKRQQNPPPMSWLQHKLFDLLSLTEKAIERRRRHYFENFALKAIECRKEEKYDIDIQDQEQTTVTPLNDIMHKYKHVISPLDQMELQKYEDIETLNMDFDNDSVASVEVNEQELVIHNNDRDLLEKSNTIDIIYQDEVLNIENSDSPQSETLQNKDLKIIANYNILPETDSPINMIPQLCVDFTDEIKLLESNINSMAIEKTITQDKKNYRNENRNISVKINKSKHNKRMNSKTSLKNIAKLKKVVSVEDGNKKIKTRKYKKLQSKLSKPIPDSLVNLCNMEENEDLKENNRNVLNNTDLHTVSHNENCLFISIVTESDEETITLRRNIGTDPEVNYNVNNETVSETVINIIKQDSFENVQSQTIFILDVNQPSTSKGVRNLSTDVQCGPDLNLTCALSPVASLMKTPDFFINGIKINDDFDYISTRKKTCEFGMCTENIDNYINTSRGIGIKIKDSNVNFHDKIGLQSEKTPENLLGDKDLTIETEVLKQILPKNDDSVSEFCDSVGRLQKSSLGFSSINTSKSQVQFQNYIDNTVSKLRKSKIITRELVHGGVHIQSFKDKMVSEDVIYQGEWKKTPKNIAKKQSNETAKTKKRMIPKNKIFYAKDKTTVNNSMVNKNSRFPQKTVPKLKNNEINSNVHKVLNTSTQKIKSVNKIPTTVRVDRTVSRVVSKIAVRTRKTKSIKSFANKKTTKYNIIAKNDIEVYREKLKNYLPRYLRRKIQIMKDINSTKVKTDIDIKTKNIIYKTENQEIAKNLLKVQDNMQHHVDYLVFQNGTDVEASVDKELILSSEQTDTVLKYECSPQSHNSSTCSSPNSVATVRPIAQNRVVINHKNNKLEQSNSGLKSEIISSKFKYQTYHKFNKKPQLDLTPKAPIHSNKENIPQTSKNIISKMNKTTKTSKSIFKGKTKNMIMYNNEHVSIKSSSTKFSKRPLKKSLKPLNSRNSNEKDSNIIDCFNSKDILLKDNINIESEIISTSTSDANDSVDELISLDKLSLKNEINNKKSFENEYTETPKQSVHDTTSSVMSVIRKLLQEKIQLTENNSKDSLISDSDTVILNKDELYRSFNSSLSPVSIKTVVANEDCILESELETVDASNDNNENQSLWSYTGIKTPIMDLDSVSYMSVASTSNSKFSEYYLADNELDITLLPQADHLLTANSVQEIFESIEENKNTVASEFLETLSGFSMNAETLLSDNVNLTDSEIGSLALTSARLTASEELLFASGRSSDTYESCFFDEDTYVPNWLFDAMNQQQSNEESNALDEQLEVLDANGNLLEPGVGAISGAGDGKGIHSDHSQDSSGRGTSLSSTASSGPENEAILIDLSAVAAYAPLNALAVSTSEVTDGTSQNNMPNGRDMTGREENQNNPDQGTSSVDGDVSSMGTDAVDVDSD